MTARELLDALQAVEDKTKPVMVYMPANESAEGAYEDIVGCHENDSEVALWVY
jgi:hypothetical protein